MIKGSGPETWPEGETRLFKTENKREQKFRFCETSLAILVSLVFYLETCSLVSVLGPAHL